MPLIDFHDSDKFAAAVEFLVRQGLPFHAREPQCILVRTEDYEALKKAKIISGSVKANGSRGRKSRPAKKS